MSAALRAIDAHELTRVIFEALKTDEVSLDRFSLNEFYDMTRLGLYSISVTRDMQQAGNHDELIEEAISNWEQFGSQLMMGEF